MDRAHSRDEGRLTVRRFGRDEWRLYRDLRLRALEESPDAFGSTHAREAERTDADWAARLERGADSPRDFPLLAEVNGAPSGLAWVRIDDAAPTVAHLYQMWVAPDRRRQGVGRALLEAAVRWARDNAAHTIALGVTDGNSEATRLYERAGFVATGESQPLRPGSTVRSRSMELPVSDQATQHDSFGLRS